MGEEEGFVRCHGKGRKSETKENEVLLDAREEGEGRIVEVKGGRGGSTVEVWEREKGSILTKYFIFCLFTVGNELRILSESSQFTQES